MPDDFSDDISTTGVIAIDGSVTGEIEDAYDRDWFAVTLSASETYEVNLRGTNGGWGTLSDPYFRGVHDSSGDYIGFSDDDGGDGYNSRKIVAVASDGVYYLSAGASANGVGTYTLSLDRLQDDFSHFVGTAGLVDVGGSLSGEINYWWDYDWIAVELEADVAYRIDAGGEDSGTGTSIDINYYGLRTSEGGYVLGNNIFSTGPGDEQVDLMVDEAGTYFIIVGGATTGTYTVSLTKLSDDYGVSAANAASLAIGGSVTLNSEYKNDRDWVAVDLVAGQAYRFSTSQADGAHVHPFIGGLWDPGDTYRDWVYDRYSSSVGAAHGYFMAAETGTHYVIGNASNRGAYMLAAEESADDYGRLPGTMGALTVGVASTGVADYAGDQDAFVVTLEAGKNYTVNVLGAATGDGTLANPRIFTIVDPDGGAAYVNYDSGESSNALSKILSAEAGEYQIAVGLQTTDLGTYTILVEEIADDYSDDIETTGFVEVGGESIAGEIEVNFDHDWFAVDLVAGTNYRLILGPPDEEFASEPGVVSLDGVYDSAGQFVTGFAHQRRPMDTAFTPQTSGRHFIAVDHYYGDLGHYTLAVEERTVEDDHRGSLNTTSVLDTGGTVSGAIDFVGDFDWFAVELSAGSLYTLEFAGSIFAGSSGWRARLKDDQGDNVTDAARPSGIYTSSAQDSTAFSVDETGTYYVAVNLMTTAVGSYTVSLDVEDNSGADDLVADGQDPLWGGGGNDTLTGDDAHNWLYGGAGNDSLVGGEGRDKLYGDAGNDTLKGDAYRDVLEGGAGNDLMFGGRGDDRVLGGTGLDTYYGGLGRDHLIEAHDETAFMYGGLDDDTLESGGGDDYLNGKQDEDSILAGAGDDTVQGGNHNDIAYLGAGDDVYSDIDAPQGRGDDTVYGEDGNDTIDGNSGYDLLDGGAGEDFILGGAGYDTIHAGAGHDTALGESGWDLIYGYDGDDSILGGSGYDTISSGAGDDTVLGDAGQDLVFGGAGSDVVLLGTGFDTWWDDDDASGHDAVWAGGGWDTLISVAGDDSLTGGAGSDTFVFAETIGHMVIEDYAVGTDALELATALWAGAFDQAGLDAISDTSGGALVLNFDVDSSLTFTGVASNAGLLDDIVLV